MVTTVKPHVLNQMLHDTGYNEEKTEFLVQGFSRGFSIGYEGNPNVTFTSKNLKLTDGDELDLWNKVMKEVKLKRYVGLYNEILFDTYKQSSIGLVPKDGGKDT